MIKTQLTAESTALQVQERLKKLYSLVQDIEKERLKNEPIINLVKREQVKAHQEDRHNSNHAQLKTMYKNLLRESKQEEELLREALAKINEIKTIRNEHRIQIRNSGIKQPIRRGDLMNMLQTSAQTLPLFVSRYGEMPPPLCGAIPAESNYIAKTGDMVAALVKISDIEENWILAEVCSWNPSTNKYTVDDIDEEQKDRHILSKSKVVPLPLMRANPKTDKIALFPKGTIVMALYPRTTCFYKGVVSALPVVATDEYEVLFEDKEEMSECCEPLGVAQRYVIVIKPNKSSKMA